MKVRILCWFAALAVLLTLAVRGQTPVTPIVPAQTVTLTAPVSATPSDIASTAQAKLKLLQELKAANDATLKIQAAQLATLDELQKAAEEIKIYSKRG